MITKRIFNRLLEFFEDDTGRLSSMRLLFLGWGVGALIVWSFLSIKSKTLLELPISITMFISSLVAGKIVQNYTERDPSGNTNNNNTTTTTTTSINSSKPPTQ